MSALAFDTYAAIKKLKEAGFTEQQAEAQTALLSEVVAGELVTKRDMKDLGSSLKQDMKDLESSLKQDMKDLESSLKQDMKGLESSLKQELRVLEERTEGRFKLLQWMLGFNLALAVAVLFLLLRH
ncbi:MAG: hypothetical protein U1F76_23955 [Candidatus Competibacteraceae bacterium]